MRRSRHRRAMALPLAGILLAVAASSSAGAATAPHGRGYEMVSPLEKGGADVYEADHQAAASGDSLVFASQATFGDTVSSFVPALSLARRSAAGWATRGVSPPLEANPHTERGGAALVSMLSRDLSRAIVVTNARLTPEAPASIGKLYVQDNATRTYRLIFAPSGPERANPPAAVLADATPDLTHVLIETVDELTQDAAQLPDDAPKVYRWHDGTFDLLSILPDGTPTSADAGGGEGSTGRSDITPNQISTDGQVGFFTARGEVNALYRRSPTGTVAVNSEENVDRDVPLGKADFRGASSDGSAVVFTSAQQLVEADTDDGQDLYLYRHTSTPTVDANLTLLSRHPGPGAPTAANVLGVLGLAGNGETVYFAAGEQLIPGEDPTAEVKLFAWNMRDGLSYIGEALGSDESLWASTSPGPVAIRRARVVSPGGNALVFVTAAELPGQPTGGQPQAYLYRRGASRAVCVSCPASVPPTGPATLASRATQHLVYHDTRNVAAEGARTFFETASPLVDGDVNDQTDVYMWEDGKAHLISTGRDETPSWFVDASESGDDIFFSTRERLVGWDSDNLRDIYDARVGGGFPEPPMPPAPCRDDECQGLPSRAPRLAEPETARGPTDGDASPRRRPAFSIGKVTRRQRARLARGFAVQVPIRVSQRGSVSLVGRATVGGRKLVVARSRQHARRASVVRLRVRLSARARRGLERAGTLRVAFTVGFSGAPEPKTKTVTLTRQPAHR